MDFDYGDEEANLEEILAKESQDFRQMIESYGVEKLTEGKNLKDTKVIISWIIDLFNSEYAPENVAQFYEQYNQ